ncbi:hypothetical protein IWQ62_005579 [Dispira parvispora]|uniref:Uncharacterized protein n=1 Tax=Dispira parvispora TaxID=1520584 RepID=A0A9W8E4E0_9FUNG|nr:hypothetical protein IWQ62_005579 [Dispira parvispora]
MESHSKKASPSKATSSEQKHNAPHGKANISTKILSMRFMQREREKQLNEELVKEEKKIQSEAQWRIPLHSTVAHSPKLNVHYETNYLALIGSQVPGRRMFRGSEKAKSTTTGPKDSPVPSADDDQASLAPPAKKPCLTK